MWEQVWYGLMHDQIIVVLFLLTIIVSAFEGTRMVRQRITKTNWKGVWSHWKNRK